MQVPWRRLQIDHRTDVRANAPHGAFLLPRANGMTGVQPHVRQSAKTFTPPLMGGEIKLQEWH